MFFVYNPQEPRYAYDPEEFYQQYRRREYITALEEQQRRAQFERELALEEERHRRVLTALSQREAAHRQQQVPHRFAPRRPQQHTSGSCACGPDPDGCIMPDYQEIFRRRQARQQEEEDLSRDFHRDILARIFGVPSDENERPTDEPANQNISPVPIAPATTKDDKSPERMHIANETSANVPAVKTPPVKDALTKPTPAQPAVVKEQVPENKQTNHSEAHWSNAPDRTRSLAEITAANRTFNALRNTFVFPSGPLEAATDSDVPRLAYNVTNAAIHAYQHALADLLSQLDGINSFGFQGVREARKQLVVKVEQAMEELEQKILERLTGIAPAPTTDQSIAKDTKEQKETQDITMDDADEQTVTSTDATTRRVIIAPETSIATNPSLHKESEEIDMSEDVDSFTIKGDTAAGDTEQREKPATVSTTSVPAEQESLESQATAKDIMETEKLVPAPADANQPRHAPRPNQFPSSKAKSVGFSVSDEEDWEIEDAVKTIT